MLCRRAGLGLVDDDAELAQRGEDYTEPIRADEDVDVDIVGRARDALLAIGERATQRVGHAVPLERTRDVHAGVECIGRCRHVRQRAVARSRRSAITELFGSESR